MPGQVGDIHGQPCECGTGNQAGCPVQDRGAEERAKTIANRGARQPPQQWNAGAPRSSSGALPTSVSGAVSCGGQEQAVQRVER